MTPRLSSLLHRLQHVRDADGNPLPYLDELMIFLDDPPPGVRDRWKQGAEMCRAWGIESTGASVWRLYKSYALEWRRRVANEATPTSEAVASLQEKAKGLAALRTFEALADPQLSTSHLVGLARIEFRKQALELAREKHRAAQSRKWELALDALSKELNKNPVALAAFDQMKEALGLD